MFQQSSIRHSHYKGFKVKRVIQIGLLLAVVIWLLNHINKKENVGGDHINFDLDEDIDLGRKAKAGSENVVFIDNHMGNFDETPETSEASEQDEASGQPTEEENDDKSFSKEKEDSQFVNSNPDQTEIQEEKLGTEHDNDDSNVDSRDASGDITNVNEDALRLRSQDDSENSLDQNEGRNIEDNFVQQNELETLDGEKRDIGEETTSEKERILSSNYQSEVTDKEAVGHHEEVKLENEVSSENSYGVDRESIDALGEDKFVTGGSRDNNLEVEKESIDSLGEDKLVTEGSSENSSEVENEATDSHGGVESEIEGKDEDKSIDTTTETNLDNFSQSLPGEENELSTSDESYGKNTLESGDVSTNDPTEHHVLENDNVDTKSEDEPVNQSASTEEKESALPTNNEVPKREAVELQETSSVNEATNDNLVQVEESKTESESKLTVTTVVDGTRNEELPVINEALERDAVESHDSSTSDGGKNDAKEESVGSNPKEDTLESKGDVPSEDQITDSVTESFSHSDEDKPKDEVHNVEVDKYQADGISREENTGTSELTVQEETPSEFDNGNTSSARTDDADSSNHGGKATE